LLLVLASVTQALAEPHDDSAAAQALFEQGKKLMAAGKQAEACPKFAESQRLDPGVGTLLNLAACYEASGRYASAWSTFLEGESAARADKNAGAARVARSRADALTSKLSQLTITVTHPDIPGLEVHRDDTVVGQAQWQLPIPADPGVHHVSASAPGREPWQTEVELKGARATVEISVPDLLVKPVPPAPPAATPPAALVTPNGTATPAGASAQSSFGTQRTLAIGAGVIGVAGVALGTVFGLKSKSKHDEADGQCNGSTCSGDGVQLRDQAISAGNLSTVSFVVGAAGLAGGALLWFTASPAKPEEPTTQVGLGFGRLLVSGRF
jgi:serine/threonine-protein kinase